MFTIFHFIFTLLKIFIQSTVYATLALVVFRLLANGQPNGNWDKVSKNKSKFWVSSSLYISVGLLIFSFTYYGDHGLGDSSIIPIGHSRSIYNGDGSFTYFYTSDNDQRHIYKYATRDDQLFAEGENNRFLIFNLETSELKEFYSKEEYENYVKGRHFPSTDEMKDFRSHYKEYWNGWRFWLLP